MNQIEFAFKQAEESASQCDRVLAVLQSNEGQWVPMPALVEASGSYVVHSRIADLKKRGHKISNKTERVNGQCHSFYMLLPY